MLEDRGAVDIVRLLAAAAADVGAVRKADKNQSQGFVFRGIDAVVNAVAPAFRKHGIVVVPNVVSVEYDTVTTAKGTTMAQVRVQVAYDFFAASDGSMLSATVFAEAMDAGDKATAKAMSVAFRTALLQTLCLPTDEPDPDHDSYERAAAPAAKPAPNGGPEVSKSQRIVLERVLARHGLTVEEATTKHLGVERTWNTLQRDDLGPLLAALAGGDE